MMKRMDYQLELTGETATLYIAGTLGNEHVETLIHACSVVSGRTLRVDLHGLGTLSAEAIGAVRQLLHFWRDSRRGEFRLTTSHMIATLYDENDTPAVPAPAWRGPMLDEVRVEGVQEGQSR